MDRFSEKSEIKLFFVARGKTSVWVFKSAGLRTEG